MGIRTPRLLLRPIRDTDLEAVYTGLSDPRVTRYMSIHYPTREAATGQMVWFRQLVEEEKGRWWAICLPDDPAMIGAVGFNNLSRDHWKAEAGYWLLPAYWGKGYAPEALQAACRFGHLALRLHRIEAVVETEHPASKQVLLQSGFHYEGTQRDAEWKDGRYISLEMYSHLTDQDTMHPSGEACS